MSKRSRHPKRNIVCTRALMCGCSVSRGRTHCAPGIVGSTLKSVLDSGLALPRRNTIILGLDDDNKLSPYSLFTLNLQFKMTENHEILIHFRRSCSRGQGRTAFDMMTVGDDIGRITHPPSSEVDRFCVAVHVREVSGPEGEARQVTQSFMAELASGPRVREMDSQLCSSERQCSDVREKLRNPVGQV